MASHNKIAILGLAFSLSACGYHLRGAYDLPQAMKSVFLQGGSQTFRDQFKTILKSSAGKLVETPEQADLIVKINNDEIVRRAVSLGQTGRSNDIELSSRLEYAVIDPKKGVLLENEPIDLRREYFNDQQDVIAKDNEETVIRKEMYQQVVRTIINRARAALEIKGK